MGLTGIIVEAKIQLEKLKSNILKIHEIKTKNIFETIKIFKDQAKKNQFIVYYEWEGILFENGPAYSYRSMEIIKTNTSNNLVYSIDALWTEKQFIDQFK